MNYISVRDISNMPNDQQYVSLKDLCNELSISIATGRNWMKSGKLTAEFHDKNVPFFTNEYVHTIKQEIQSGANKSLKSRRNKKYVSGNSIYNFYVSEQSKNIIILQKLLAIIESENIELTPPVIRSIIADCSLHLFSQALNLNFCHEKHLLAKFLNQKISTGKYDELIRTLIDDSAFISSFCKEHPCVFEMDYILESHEDVLGLIYISCNNIGNRKATGSYFTPNKLVEKLISRLEINAHDRVLDPCCGTGNFLLQLPANVPFNNIYGNDIDENSTKITRLNMALKFPEASVSEIYEHITELDYLTEYPDTNFQFIIGNPPWGYCFSDAEQSELKKLFKAASGTKIESYDVFIERSLDNLTINGQLSFVLPEAVLNVKLHKDIRNIIMHDNSIKYLEFLGNAFDGVQCPCIILQLLHTNTALSTIGMAVTTSKNTFSINTNRNVTSDYFSFLTTDEEYKLLEKIRNCSNAAFLANNADFALGIVTGNNKKYVTHEKTDENEIVLKGTDISKYHINPPNSYIVFRPDYFQQTAPIEMYRAPEKLLYRFISNQLVFAYDNNQTLSLNSCNIVIPKLKNVSPKYVLAILNSRIAQFIYKMGFNSLKVLRSHIESIPIPYVSRDIQYKIIELTDALIDEKYITNMNDAFEQLDQLIFNIFNLTSDEQQIIRSVVDRANIII